MTEQEYKDKLKAIHLKADLEIRSTHIEYAKSMRIFKVGDIIKDYRWILEIDNISTSISFGIAQPVYNGFELKKDLTPRKDKNRVAIYGNKATLITK